MATLTNICPSCKSDDIARARECKYGCASWVLIILGIPLVFFGIGIILMAAGIIMLCIKETSYRCNTCKVEWK